VCGGFRIEVPMYTKKVSENVFVFFFRWNLGYRRLHFEKCLRLRNMCINGPEDYFDNNICIVLYTSVALCMKKKMFRTSYHY
jgi:hypothetical protein